MSWPALQQARYVPLDLMSGTHGRPRVLIVDDDPIVVEMLRFLLERDGWQTDVATSYAKALTLLATNSIDLLMVETGLAEGDGIAFCAMARRAYNGLIVAMSRADAGRAKAAGLAAGADEHLVKPFDASELMARLAALRRRQGWQRDEQRQRLNRSPRRELGGKTNDQ